MKMNNDNFKVRNLGKIKVSRIWICKDIEGDVIRMRKELVGIVPSTEVNDLVTRDFAKLECKFNDAYDELVERGKSFAEECDFFGPYKTPALYINDWELVYRGYKYGYDEMYYRYTVISEYPMEGYYDKFQYR